MVLRFPQEYEWVVGIRELSVQAKISLVHLLYSATEIASDGSLVCRGKAVDILKEVFDHQIPYPRVLAELSNLGLVKVVGNLTFLYLDKIKSLYDLYNVKDVSVQEPVEDTTNVTENTGSYSEKVKDILRDKEFLRKKRRKDPLVERLVTTLQDQRSRNFYEKLVEYVSVGIINEALHIVTERVSQGGRIRNYGAYFVGVLKNMLGGNLPWKKEVVVPSAP